MTVTKGGPLRLSVPELEAAAPLDLGVGEWFTVEQDRIDAFADATDDWQWIHVDHCRAATSDFGGTIAHGYLILSLIPLLLDGLMQFTAYDNRLNYGIDRLRYLSPVRSGARIRARAHISDTRRSNSLLLYGIEVTIEVEDSDRPALVAKLIYGVQEAS